QRRNAAGIVLPGDQTIGNPKQNQCKNQPEAVTTQARTVAGSCCLARSRPGTVARCLAPAQYDLRRDLLEPRGVTARALEQLAAALRPEQPTRLAASPGKAGFHELGGFILIQWTYNQLMRPRRAFAGLGFQPGG